MQQYYELVTPTGIMRGFLHKPSKEIYPICIIFHGFTGQKTGTKFSYVRLSRMLEEAGIATMRLDFLGSGESDLRFRDMTFDEELTSAKLVLEKVLQMPAVTEVYILGHSMGGVIASELAKEYPQDIKRLCLWAPAFNLPEALHYLIGKIPPNGEGIYNHNGFEISQAFVDDMVARNFYEGLDIYENPLLVIHGTKDATVPYRISERYIASFSERMQFISIEDGTHNFDTVTDIKKVLQLTFEFLINDINNKECQKT